MTTPPPSSFPPQEQQQQQRPAIPPPFPNGFPSGFPNSPNSPSDSSSSDSPNMGSYLPRNMAQMVPHGPFPTSYGPEGYTHARMPSHHQHAQHLRGYPPNPYYSAYAAGPYGASSGYSSSSSNNPSSQAYYADGAQSRRRRHGMEPMMTGAGMGMYAPPHMYQPYMPGRRAGYQRRVHMPFSGRRTRSAYPRFGGRQGPMRITAYNRPMYEEDDYDDYEDYDEMSPYGMGGMGGMGMGMGMGSMYGGGMGMGMGGMYGDMDDMYHEMDGMGGGMGMGMNPWSSSLLMMR
ncbi:hypothetical protein BT63DRAFT_456215 [Microthyrium microscopicum]|uniref:Uncharacterized protein n=1 Tax=Microthyrium microscopicum TaxID=703497 RepID=A0A6A6U8S6_9PEZI|nr:hypothetical protein BT63DRAFT_456215 [Microthyrium microscopicum]